MMSAAPDPPSQSIFFILVTPLTQGEPMYTLDPHLTSY